MILSDIISDRIMFRCGSAGGNDCGHCPWAVTGRVWQKVRAGVAGGAGYTKINNSNSVTPSQLSEEPKSRALKAVMSALAMSVVTRNSWITDCVFHHCFSITYFSMDVN